jgi:transposase
VSRDAISDEVWAVIGPLFPPTKATGRPPVDRRQVVEATARRGTMCRNGLGTRNTVYKNFDRWAKAGVAS